MIVVLGLGRETRAWLDRTLRSDVDVLLLDESDRSEMHLPDGRVLRVVQVDLDDTVDVRAAVAGRTIDEVVRSPGISPYRPGPAWLASAAPCTTPTGRWLLSAAPTDLVAISGTKGKSTLTALTAHLLRAAGREVILAGNIGVALSSVDPSTPRDDLVVELSSYQITDLALAVPARAAGLTTLFVDHVPWHGSVARYHADKLRLLELAEWRVVGPQVAASGRAEGRYDAVAGRPTPEVRAALAEVGMHGVHEGEIAMLALALAARRTGTDATALVDALADFRPLPHRLRPIGQVAGVTYVDDSISTVPESTLAALATWQPLGPVTLLLGGDDRGQDLTGLLTALASPDVRAALLPPLGARLAAAVAADRVLASSGRIVEVDDLAAAVAWAHTHTPAGGAVLLSPAAPSFGAFRDFIDRAEAFATLVTGLDTGPERPS
jgi:UDP-N-acetylmuramoylalanine--D-glutamate ligase